LQEGTHRFSELRRRITGVSEKMLAQTLQTLTNDGLIERKSYPVVPPFVEYSLTPLGIEAAKHVVALTGWIELNLTKILAQQSDSAESIKE
jgi:DNA-binding HxlR family transcriptional regulator